MLYYNLCVLLVSSAWIWILLLFLIYFFFIFEVFIRPIISRSTRLIFTKFSGLVELGLQMIKPKLVFQFVKGRCRSDQFLLVYPHN